VTGWRIQSRLRLAEWWFTTEPLVHYSVTQVAQIGHTGRTVTARRRAQTRL